MKGLKTADVLIQLLAIIYIIAGTMLEGGALFTGLFVLGGIQILSVLAHIPVKREQWIVKARTVYYWLLLIPVGVFIYALSLKPDNNNNSSGIAELFFVGLFSYLLGLFYFVITIIEWRRLKKTN